MRRAMFHFPAESSVSPRCDSTLFLSYGHCIGRVVRSIAHCKGEAITRPMIQRATDTKKPEVLQGTLDLMILKTLQALGPLHGFGIARRIEQGFLLL